VNREEPLANLLEVMQHLMSHNGHLKTAIIPRNAGQPPEAFLRPAEFVASPGALEARLDAGRALATRAGWPRIITRISTWSASCCPSACTRISTTSIPICRWADDLGDEIGDTAGKPAPARMVARRTDACMRAKPRIRFRRAARIRSRGTNLPKQPFADLIRRSIQDQTVTRYQTWESCSITAVYSANPVGRLVLYLCGYSDAERQRLSDATCTALQLANFWQDVTVDLLKGPRLSAARPSRPPRLHGGGSLRAPLRRRASARRCGGRGRGARAVHQGLPLAAWWTGAWRSISNCSAAAACKILEKSSSRITTYCARGRRSRRLSASACCWARWRERRFPRRMISLEFLCALPRRGAQRAKNFYYSFLLLSGARTPCAPSTPSCATATI
jgi:hypothetical protein